MATPTLIFDMDGVLVDSEPIANTVFADHLGRFGVSMTVDEVIAQFRGLRLDDCVAWVQTTYDITLPADFIETLQVETFQRLEAALQPIPNVESALSQLSYPMCLASSSAPDKIALSLRVTGLGRYFPPERRFSGTQVPRGKPDPALFRLAASTVGADPRDCLVIEDSVAGVQAARRAGMAALGYAPNNHNQEGLVKAGAIVYSDMCSLPAMIAGVWANVLFARG
ncbi:MAG: HAD family phosphatase [Myxococcota bacterium]